MPFPSSLYFLREEPYGIKQQQCSEWLVILIGIRKDWAIGHIADRTGRINRTQPKAQSFRSGVERSRKGGVVWHQCSLPASQWCPCCLWQRWGTSISYNDTQFWPSGSSRGNKLPQVMVISLPHALWGVAALGIVRGTFSHSFHSLRTTAHCFGRCHHHDYNHCCSLHCSPKGWVSPACPFPPEVGWPHTYHFKWGRKQGYGQVSHSPHGQPSLTGPQVGWPKVPHKTGQYCCFVPFSTV